MDATRAWHRALLLRTSLYSIPTTGAFTCTGSAVLAVVVMLAVSYLPAWRASRVDPMVVLRFE